MLLLTSPHIACSLLLLALLLSLAASQTAQCDLENMYMLGDIAIPSTVDSEPMFQDDYSKILTTEEQAQEVHRRHRRAAVRDRSRIWPDNTIPYVIEPDFQEHSVALLKRAMQTWADVSCIRFIPRTTEQDYLHIKTGRRCCSYVGRQKRGSQKMALDQGCMIHGILLHELGHVIGFWHEQNRPDRDEYIQVLPNYHDSVSYNFDKRNESEVSDYGVEYDYDSIMHYGQTFFSVDGKSTTLLPLKPGVQIGQRQGLSPLDILQANRLYMCQADCSWTFNASEQAGSFQSMNYPENYPAKTDCITRLHADEGQIIRVNFQTIDIEHHSACTYDYLEVRDGDLPTSPLLGRFCGNLPPKNFTSTGPNLWIKFHSDSSVSKDGFFAHYVAFDKEETKATKMNPCELKTCLHACNVVEGTATCNCPQGFHLNDDGFTCRDVNECMYNNGGCSHICLNSQSSFTCHCPRGYLLGDNGLTCIDINECTSGRSQCTQICINTPGSYYCDCLPAYRLDYDFTTCKDYDECAVRNGGCEQECTNYEGGFECECEDGYELDTEDNSSCLDIDECQYNRGGCDQLCTNTLGGRDCSCNHGYELDSTLLTHCNDVDECSDGENGGCEQICHNLPGANFCSCRTGFRLLNETHCQDIDECETVQCVDGTCRNEPGSYHCTCEDYQVLHPTDPHHCIYGMRTEVEEGEENLTEENNSLLQGGGVRTTSKYSNPVCGNQELTGEPGLITSPHYPSFYPTNTRCSWLISGRPQERVEITLLHFDLERIRYCSYDSLRIYDGASEGDPYLANLCGRIKSKLKIASSGQNLFLKFKSDIMYVRPGFSAAVDFIALNRCGGRYVTGPQSRPLALKSQDGRQCMWSLASPDGTTILLNFIKFKMFGSTWTSTCSVEDAIEIYTTSDRTLIARFCTSNPPPKLYISRASHITIVARALSEATTMDLLLLHSATSLKYV